MQLRAGSFVTAYRGRDIRRAAVLATIVVAATVLSSCQVARVGARCMSGFGRNATHVLVCRNHRWTRLMTIGDYARILIARNQPALVHGWQVNGVGWAATTLGGTAYIGGEFSVARAHDGSSSLPRRNLVAVSTATGQPTGFRADTNGRVRSLATDGARLYVAGSFTSINGVARNHLAALDLQSGAVLPGRVHNTDNDVYALSVGGGRLYAVGNFSQIDGAARQRVASIDLATNHLNGFVANAAGGGVNAVAATADGSRVYLGGVYSSVNGTPTTALTALDGSGGVVRFPSPASGVPLSTSRSAPSVCSSQRSATTPTRPSPSTR